MCDVRSFASVVSFDGDSVYDNVDENSVDDDDELKVLIMVLLERETKDSKSSDDDDDECLAADQKITQFLS